MTQLTGIKAFEACWQLLSSSISTNAMESRMLMQSMGRLIDNYAPHEEIVQELPFALRDIFDQLVDAYLNGYWLDTAISINAPTEKLSSASAPVSPAMLAAAQLRQRRAAQPTSASEAATYIIHDPFEKAECVLKAVLA